MTSELRYMLVCGIRESQAREPEVEREGTSGYGCEKNAPDAYDPVLSDLLFASTCLGQSGRSLFVEGQTS